MSFLSAPYGSPGALPGSGSIRPSVGWSNFTGEKRERFERLRRDFEQIDKNNDKILSFEEVYDFLKARSPNGFDKEMCQMLFAQMDKNQDMNVTTDEFVLCFVETENALQIRMQELRAQIQTNLSQLEDYRRNLTHAKNIQRKNGFNIDEDSVLTVSVIDAQNLIPINYGNTSNPYVQLSCERQRIETSIVYNDLNPVWNEVFTFQIQQGKEDLRVVVLHSDAGSGEGFLGQVNIPLTILSDQMKLDRNFELLSKNRSDPWQGKVHLGLQWVWDRVEYLEEVIRQWQENIELDKQEYKHLENQLQKLQSPFGLLDVNIDRNSRAIKMKKTPSDRKTLGFGLQGFEEAYVQRFDTYAEQMFNVSFNWDVATLYATYFFAIISALVMFARPDFVNLTLAVFAIYILLSGEFSNEWAFRITLSMVGLLIYDLIWLFLSASVRYKQNWGGGVEEADGFGNGMRRIALLLSIASFVTKFVLTLIYWRHIVKQVKQGLFGLLAVVIESWGFCSLSVILQLWRRRGDQRFIRSGRVT